jgi:hypothetical protein
MPTPQANPSNKAVEVTVNAQDSTKVTANIKILHLMELFKENFILMLQNRTRIGREVAAS